MHYKCSLCIINVVLSYSVYNNFKLEPNAGLFLLVLAHFFPCVPGPLVYLFGFTQNILIHAV